MVRVTTISRSAVAWSLSAAVIRLLPPLKLLHVPVEPGEAATPKLLEPAYPLVDWPEAPRVEAVEPLLSLSADPDEPYLTENAQVLGGARLGDAQRPRHVVDRAFTAFEQREDPTTLRLGDRIEHVGGGRGSCHARQHIPIWENVKPKHESGLFFQ